MEKQEETRLRVNPYEGMGNVSELTENPCVPGSIPGPGTSRYKRLEFQDSRRFFVLGLFVQPLYNFFSECRVLARHIASVSPDFQYDSPAWLSLAFMVEPAMARGDSRYVATILVDVVTAWMNGLW